MDGIELRGKKEELAHWYSTCLLLQRSPVRLQSWSDTRSLIMMRHVSYTFPGVVSHFTNVVGV